jgi:cell wall-associated NlpC family hydrolase
VRYRIRVLIVAFLPVVMVACASSGAVPRPFPGASIPPGASEPAATAVPTPDVVAMALKYQGVPYRDGGSEPSGSDCSGFVQWVFARVGQALPREVREQYKVGKKVDRDEIKPGDLVFFQTVSRGASHVGIALDGERFVHAPSSRGVVRVERYTSDYWKKRYVGARRVE